jgi:hypothetical protein
MQVIFGIRFDSIVNTVSELDVFCNDVDRTASKNCDTMTISARACKFHFSNCYKVLRKSICSSLTRVGAFRPEWHCAGEDLQQQ